MSAHSYQKYMGKVLIFNKKKSTVTSGNSRPLKTPEDIDLITCNAC